MTAKELYLKVCYDITRCPRDAHNNILGCDKCTLVKKTACTMELIAWRMVKGGEM